MTMIYIVMVARAFSGDKILDVFADADLARRWIEVAARLDGVRGEWRTGEHGAVFTDGIDEWHVFPRDLRVREEA